MWNKKNAVWMSILISALASGCGTTKNHDAPGMLAKNWERQFREYQIFPVFPPREDIQVGDVYLGCHPDLIPKGEQARALDGYQPISYFVASLPGVAAALRNHYGSRFTFPETGTSPKTGTSQDTGKNSSKTENSPLSATKSITEIFTDPPGSGDNRSVLRLRSVSFPDFFRATVSGGNLDVLVPAEMFLVGLGLGMENVSSISVSVPASESYGLPLSVMPKLIDQLLPEGKFQDNEGLEKMLQGTLLSNSGNSCVDGNILVVITEIFAARAIDVVMNFKSTAAAQLRADFMLTPDSQKKKLFDALTNKVTLDGGVPSSKPTETENKAATNGSSSPHGSGSDTPIVSNTTNPNNSSTTSTTPTSNKISTAEERADLLLAETRAILAEIEKSTQRQFPGVTAKVYSGGASGMTLTRTFANPIVIGYRAIFLRPEVGEDGRRTWGYMPQPKRGPTPLGSSRGNVPSDLE